MPAGLVHAPHEEITHEIIGAAYAVHNRLGPGEREFIYQRALEDELHARGLNFAAEIPVEVCDGDKLIGYYIPDLIVEDKVVVELKANARLQPEHFSQTIAYINHLRLAVGLLLNFGERSMVPKRLFPSPPAVEFHADHRWLRVPDKLKEKP